jgi:signal transduction histidine kinase/ActR/RegA family two-component response regulator
MKNLLSSNITTPPGYKAKNIGVILCGLMLLIFSIFSVVENRSSQQKIKEIENIHVSLPFTMSRLFSDVNLAAGAQNKYFETGEIKFETERKNIWLTKIKPVSESLKQLKAKAGVETDDQQLIEKAVSGLEDYQIAQEELNLIWKDVQIKTTPGEKKEAENILNQKRLAFKILTQDDATAILIPIQNKYQQKATAEMQIISNSTKNSSRTLLLTILFTILLISVLILRQRDLLKAKRQAEVASIAKSDFLSVMSHEIRTPINGVIGIANLLQEETLNGKQMEYVKTLSFSAQHLLSLVSDILDFSKIESGKLQLEKTSFHLETVCNHVFDLYKSKAEEKGIAYTFTPAPIKDYSLYGDPTRLSQILSNMLSNAIKFTDGGAVDFSYSLKAKATVELSYSLRENDNHKVVIDFIVKDTGIGIAKEAQGKIFESFSQADKSTTRQYGGSGLGLTICKKLVELHGGVIQLNSVVGKGTEFIITIPFEKHVYNNKEEVEKNVKKTFKEDLTGMKILVAEDNHINAMVLTRFLHKWKAEFKVAKDGKEALDFVSKEHFHVILMDLQMPVMDGMEATVAIRNSTNKIISHIPIVAFTADALSENHVRLIKMGFDHCLTKPFNPDALLKFLKKYHTNAA